MGRPRPLRRDPQRPRRGQAVKRVADERHLIEILDDKGNPKRCMCGERATRMIRCFTCRAVIARCGAAKCGGERLPALALEHCAPR